MVNGPAKPLTWQITYLGWSGFHIHQAAPHNSASPHRGGPQLFVDPPEGTSFPDDAAITIFITHGHPEHLGGTLDHIREVDAKQRTVIVASEKVCRYLAGQSKRGMVDFLSIKPGQRQALAPEFSFEAFQWRHMPLLPPGLAAAARHIMQLLRGFRAAWQIIKMSLHGPKGPGDMLGYLLRLQGNTNIIIYGEGLHRHCRAEEVAAIGRKAPGATLLVASEPEDFAELPLLVAASGAAEAILYEPHSPWRETFSLPHVDLTALQKAVSDAGVPAKIIKPGQ